MFYNSSRVPLATAQLTTAIPGLQTQQRYQTPFPSAPRSPRQPKTSVGRRRCRRHRPPNRAPPALLAPASRVGDRQPRPPFAINPPYVRAFPELPSGFPGTTAPGSGTPCPRDAAHPPPGAALGTGMTSQQDLGEQWLAPARSSAGSTGERGPVAERDEEAHGFFKRLAKKGVRY